MVQDIGVEKALLICGETADVLSKGGMDRADGKGKRTPGGVFLTIAKAHIDSEDIKRFYKTVARRPSQRNTPRKTKRGRYSGLQQCDFNS